MIKVGVLRGGIGDSYDASISSGRYILSNLRSDKLNSDYKAIDIFVDIDGIWHIGGIPTTLEKVAEKVDLIFNALHGDYGQNGNIQKLLENYNIPYTGSDSSTCAYISNGFSIKEDLSKIGVNIPSHILYGAYLEDLDGPQDKYIKKITRDVLNRLSPPWVVKPINHSSSMGVFICKTIQDLMNAFNVGVHKNVSIIVEEIIEGRDTYVSVINNFRGKEIYPLLCTDNFTNNEKREVERLAALVHDKLNLKHYSQSHFIVNPKKGIFLMEVNALPSLHEDSLLNKHLNDIGLSSHDFINHIIKSV